MLTVELDPGSSSNARSSIRLVPCTTLDIDATVLRELQRRQREDGRPLGEVASDLLKRALAADSERRSAEPLGWRGAYMAARIDLEDDDATRTALEVDEPSTPPDSIPGARSSSTTQPPKRPRHHPGAAVSLHPFVRGK